MSESKLRLLDKFSEFVVGNVFQENGEPFPSGKNFSGRTLDEVVRSFSALRHDCCRELLEADPGRYRELFKDLSITDFAASSRSAWSGSPEQYSTFLKSVPVLAGKDALNSWRSHPDFGIVSSIFCEIEVTVSMREVKGIPSLDGMCSRVLFPRFPEWYQFVSGESPAQRDERVEFLVDFESAFNELVTSENRLPEDKITHLYLAFIDEIFPQFRDNEVGQLFAGLHAKLSSICGWDVRGENGLGAVINLPDCYKEYILLTMNDRIKPKIIPHLLNMVSD